MSGAVGAPAPPTPGTVVRSVATLGAGELFSRLVGFAGTIYIARVLGAEAYGVVGFGLAVLLYATAVIDAGMEHTGPHEVASAGDRLPLLVSSLILARTAWGVIVTGAVLVAMLLLFDGEERLVLALYSLALLPVGPSPRWVHLGLQRAGTVSLTRVVSDVLRVLTIFLLVRGPADLVVVPAAQVASDILAVAIFFAALRSAGLHVRMQVDWRVVRTVFRRAAPMAVSGLLAVMIYNADLVFLRVFRDHAEIGLYLAGYTLLNFLGILGHVTALTLVPAFTRLSGARHELITLYRQSLGRAFAAGLPMAVGGCLIAPLLIRLVFGESYDASWPVLAVLVWSMPVVLMRGVLQAALISRGRQDYVLRTTLVAATTNVALNMVAVPLFGMYGAAATTLLAETLRMLAALLYAHRTGLPMLPARPLVQAAGGGAAIAVALLLVRPASVWVALPLGALAYAAGLFLTGALRVQQRRLELTI